jgi:hypothetical protein
VEKERNEKRRREGKVNRKRKYDAERTTGEEEAMKDGT